ncbi:MAG: ATP-binding protein [Sulfuricellaceae bacterium]
MYGKESIFRFIDWVATSFALALILLLPAGYYALSYQHLEGRLNLELHVKAQRVGLHINTQPELWRFEELRLISLLRGEGDETAEFSQVLDLHGQVISRLSEPPPAPNLKLSATLYDAGAPVGVLEVASSLRPLLFNTGLVALVGLALGLVVFFPLRLVPRRALQQALDELAQEQEQLRLLNETLEQRVTEEVNRNREKDHLLIQQSRLAAMGEMVGSIAHQWRQPINTVNLILQNIRDDYRYGELSDESLNRSVELGNRVIQDMSRTIDDFRNFFRPNKEKKPFQIRRSVDNVRALVDAAFQRRGIEVEIEGDEELEVLGYENEYAQVLLNVLNNAKEAIAARGVANGRISIHLARTDGEARVTVSDNGGGIKAEAMERIFDPYFSTKALGSGIGLYMSKMIIEQNMGGRIYAGNIPDGAEFTLVLPLREAASAG